MESIPKQNSPFKTEEAAFSLVNHYADGGIGFVISVIIQLLRRICNPAE
jgi:hypothetical protein